MYAVAGLVKVNDAWLSGDAVERALHFDIYARPRGKVLLQYPAVLPWLSWGTLALELAMPLLLFCPWQTRRARGAMVVVLLLLHAGMELTMTLGLFPWVCLVAFSSFLPPTFWRLWPMRAASDGIDRLFAAMSRRKGAPVAPDAARLSNWRRAATIGSSAICAFFVAYTVFWNVTTVPFDPLKDSMPKSWKWLGRASGTRQEWKLFIWPEIGDGWPVARARLADGSVVDLLRDGEPVSYEKPDNIAAIFPNHYWRHHMRMTAMPRRESFREPAARYLAKQWNDQHEDDKRQVVVLDLIFFVEPAASDRNQEDYATRTLAHITFGDPVRQGNFNALLQALERGETTLP